MKHRVIAHRGLTHGPNKNIENVPERVIGLIERGIDCEVDLQIVDGGLFLGHDTPDYEVDIDFLCIKGLWIHCKTSEALQMMSSIVKLRNTNYFFHDIDQHTLTSRGIIWSHPAAEFIRGAVMVVPETCLSDAEIQAKLPDSYAICTDYVAKYTNAMDT